mmetsp:Transcript_13127/g.18878  ORF Transcript_13127/g.18878 Transcript_13127/m.18878 type:complete len:142 (-) Transcript_13127:101-526(-)
MEIRKERLHHTFHSESRLLHPRPHQFQNPRHLRLEPVNQIHMKQHHTRTTDHRQPKTQTQHFYTEIMVVFGGKLHHAVIKAKMGNQCQREDAHRHNAHECAVYHDGNQSVMMGFKRSVDKFIKIEWDPTTLSHQMFVIKKH